MKKVKEDSIVKIQFTGTLNSGEIFDGCDATDPVEFELGTGVMVPAFEDQLGGMQINEKKTFSIPYEKAYGAVVKDSIKRFAKSEFENHTDLKPGVIIAVELNENERTPATVVHVDDESVSIDMNHPLAGQNLNFEVQLLEIIHPSDTS